MEGSIEPWTITQVNLQLAQYPHWSLLLVGLTIDYACRPLMCSSWRDFVPFGLADSGQGLSDEYILYDVFKIFPSYPTFSEFRSQTGGQDHWLKDLYTYCFLTPSTKLSNLMTFTALIPLFVLVMVLRVFKYKIMSIFTRIGRNWAIRSNGEEWVSANEERVTKFGEYVYRLFYHSFIGIAGVLHFWNAPWWTNGQTRIMWDHYPYADVQPGLTWYYLIQAAYNVDAFVSLLEISFVFQWNKVTGRPMICWSRTVRGDFKEMMIHHVITNLLVFLSSLFRFTIPGSMVFMMHDISDVPVDLCKLAYFLKWEGATIFIFLILIITWAYTRLYVLPFTIFWTCYFESSYTSENEMVEYKYIWAFRSFFLFLIGSLIALHAFWFAMFMKMGFRLVRTGVARDYSEKDKR